MGHDWIYIALTVIGAGALLYLILLALRGWWLRSREDYLRRFRQEQGKKNR